MMAFLMLAVSHANASQLFCRVRAAAVDDQSHLRILAVSNGFPPLVHVINDHSGTSRYRKLNTLLFKQRNHFSMV